MRERRCVSLLPRTTLHSESEHHFLITAGMPSLYHFYWCTSCHIYPPAPWFESKGYTFPICYLLTTLLPNECFPPILTYRAKKLLDSISPSSPLMLSVAEMTWWTPTWSCSHHHRCQSSWWMSPVMLLIWAQNAWCRMKDWANSSPAAW
jgi:hypothetical protein